MGQETSKTAIEAGDKVREAAVRETSNNNNKGGKKNHPCRCSPSKPTCGTCANRGDDAATAVAAADDDEDDAAAAAAGSAKAGPGGEAVSDGATPGGEGKGEGGPKKKKAEDTLEFLRQFGGTW
ncbi:hypothetical protein VTK26DRAFT_4809 [Humicola hyalothermophila]